MRVIARYLCLEHAVRLIGDLTGQPLNDLIQAADIVAVPSRVQTEWWPILAAWAAGKPVVTTHAMEGALQLQHEINAILAYPHESSIVWGIERLLFNWDLATKIAANGHQLLQERHGFSAVAAQVDEILGLSQAR